MSSRTKLYFMPFSPRWLIDKGREDEAQKRRESSTRQYRRALAELKELALDAAIDGKRLLDRYGRTFDDMTSPRAGSSGSVGRLDG